MSLLLRDRNPMILGEDPTAVLMPVVGAGVTGALNDNFVRPTASKFLPSVFNPSSLIGREADAVTTIVTAKVVGAVGRKLNARWGNLMELGGTILGGYRVLKGFAPGFFPEFGSISIGQLHAAGAQKALPAAGVTTVSGVTPGTVANNMPPAPVVSAVQNPELYSGF